MQAMYNLSPWGEYRADMMIAELCRCVLMPHIGKGASVPDHHSFTPFIKRPEKTQEELIRSFEVIAKGS